MARLRVLACGVIALAGCLLASGCQSAAPVEPTPEVDPAPVDPAVPVDPAPVEPAAAVDPAPSEANPLAGTEWRLVALGDAGAPVAVVGGESTAAFTATELTGWTACNAYGARYRVRDAALRLDDLGWTEAGCPSQALFRQEQRMQDALATVERFAVSGDRLTLHSAGGQVLVFERVGT